jgi:hypothetical protein
MKAVKIIRNILGTAGLLYAGYVLIASVKDVRRYIRINTLPIHPVLKRRATIRRPSGGYTFCPSFRHLFLNRK